MRFNKAFAGLAMLTGAMVASGAAFAGPTVTVDNVTLPVGITPGGFYFDNEISAETLLTAKGQAFEGVFSVSQIGNSALQTTWTSGQNGAYLYGAFQGFNVDSITGTPSTGITILLNGAGTISYYESSTNNFTASSGTVAADVAADTTGSLFLEAQAEQINSAGDTLELSIPAGGSTSSFTQAGALAYLNVIGGDAAYNFTTQSLVNSFTGQAADIIYSGQANSGSNGTDFGVTGSNTAKANIVPEPLTISLFGAGLVGVTALRRRKAKKA